MSTTLQRLLRGLPAGESVPASRLKQRAAAAGRVRVVLDDDPTGTQSVRNLPVLLTWTQENFRWAFSSGEPAVYVMTNSRSLAEADAVRVNRQVAANAIAAAQATGTSISLVSRSDSTLRGHFPAETDALADVLAAASGRDVDGVLLVPAFGEAGRITVGSTHYASADGGYMPVGESVFATDATFGYSSSDLGAWVEEKTRGVTRASDVTRLPLEVLRGAGARVVDVLSSLSNRRVCVVDSVNENDLRLLCLAAYESEAAGRRLLYRVGPPFVRALIGQEPSAPVDAHRLAEILGERDGPGAARGLVVVGSHVPGTTQQLHHLLEHTPVHHVEFDVTALADSRPAVVGRAIEEVTRTLGERDVVLSTSRQVVTAGGSEASLELSRRVSAALVDVVDAVVGTSPPSFVIAKGGITSSDVALHGLHIERAMVVGPLLDGIVSLWRPVSGPARGVPYVVFAGNVGGPSSLTEVVLKFEGARGHG